jgi:hypothetical protein
MSGRDKKKIETDETYVGRIRPAKTETRRYIKGRREVSAGKVLKRDVNVAQAR